MPDWSVDAKLRHALSELIRSELGAPIPEAVRAIGELVRARHASGARALLFYGSCRRDGWSPDALVDLYLLVKDYQSVHAARLARLANRLLPPNVYVLEADTALGRVRAKYAIVALDQFCGRMRARNPYFWARFAQPSSLVWAADERVREAIVAACVQAVLTAWAVARALQPGETDPAVLWPSLFAATYATELRSERKERGQQLYWREPLRYDRIATLLAHWAPMPPLSPAVWRWRCFTGKLLSAARLFKAGFTFAGGADYLAWKIERHSGVRVKLGAFHRRHPLLAAALLGLTLYLRRAFR